MAESRRFNAIAYNYMQMHETSQVGAYRQPCRTHGRAITPPVIGNGTPVVAG